MSVSRANGLVVLRADTSDPPKTEASPRAAPPPKPRAPKGYETVDSVLLTEPRIEAIRRELQALLQVVELESGGVPVEIDGFRLRDASHWADYPSSLSDIFWHLSSVCNFSCEFCYEKGNPPDFPIQNLPRMATEDEIETRLRYYDPLRRTGVFTVRTSINEPFANRRAIEFLRRMREKSPTELISFVTNGAYLNEDTVRALKDLQPLFFNLSIYSTDREIRRKILVDRHPDRAVEAVDLLARHEIPYMTNLVMWPSIPFTDMERTIAFMAERRATVLRVCLGGYSRYLQGDWERFDVDEYWPRVVSEVERLRDRYPIPILIEPSSFVRHDTESVIDGVVRDSPADLAGLRRGDRLCQVNGRTIRSRMQLLAELRRVCSGGERSYRPPGVVGVTEDILGGSGEAAELQIERGGERFTVMLDRYAPRSMATYPYGHVAQYHDFMYGLVLTDCLRYSSLQTARALMEKHRARRVLLLTSVMIQPMLGYMLEATNAFAGFDVSIRVARNEYFGGTINVGDLLVVQDFIEAIREFLAEEGSAVDLVLIPASPFASSPWGRDLTGRPWQEIERAVGIPVDLIPCPNITF